jgi:Lon protease-like protein
VPLFPLGGALLFPRAQLPLHIFETRYREMVRDAIDGAGRIGMIQPLRDDTDNQAPLYAVGCVGDIVGIEELDDGRFNIVLLGTDRFRLIGEPESDAAYRCGEVDIQAFDDSDPPPLSLGARAEVERDRDWNEGAARKRFLQLLEAQGLEDEWARAQRRRLSALLFT